VLEVRGAQRFRLAGRMKGISKANEPADAIGSKKLVRAHAGDASAHGLAADQQLGLRR
jgi:hypothetical protein